jgi:hypothetical protein
MYSLSQRATLQECRKRRTLGVFNTYQESTTALFFPYKEHQETPSKPFGTYNLESALEQRHYHAKISASSVIQDFQTQKGYSVC